MKRAQLEIDLHKEESHLITLPKIDHSSLVSLCNLSVIYKKGESKLKRDITRCLFPEGFSLDIESKTLQTARLNKLFTVNDSKSINYKFMEIKNETNLATCPVLGERPDSNRRPSEPQTDALTN